MAAHIRNWPRGAAAGCDRAAALCCIWGFRQVRDLARPLFHWVNGDGYGGPGATRQDGGGQGDRDRNDGCTAGCGVPRPDREYLPPGRGGRGCLGCRTQPCGAWQVRGSERLRPRLEGPDAEAFEARRAALRQQFRAFERARRIRAGEPLLQLHRDSGESA